MPTGNQLTVDKCKIMQVQTIILAVAMVPGVMLVSSNRIARGCGPECHAQPDFPTDVGPRKMARRICWAIILTAIDMKKNTGHVYNHLSPKQQLLCIIILIQNARVCCELFLWGVQTFEEFGELGNCGPIIEGSEL